MHFQNVVGIVALVLSSCSSVYATSNQNKYNDIRSLLLEYLGRSDDVAPVRRGGFDGAYSIGEYRIEMPLTLDEFNRGHLYTVAEASKAETGGGEGVEIVTNEPFEYIEGLGGPGQYTHKIYHLASKVPRWVRILAPKGSLEFKEESWNIFPYTKTVITNPEYMKDKFTILIETWNEVGRCEIENFHNLSPEQLAKRYADELIDLTGYVRSSDYKEEFDPTKCTSEKTGRGPLKPDQGQSEADPVMCSYKLVTTQFLWFGLQSRVEKFTLNGERRLFMNFHRQMYCDLDDYVDLSMDDIRNIEEETKHELDELRSKGDVTGTIATE